MACWLRPCKWQYIGIVQRDLTRGKDFVQRYEAGLYQCTRCKTLSIGSPTDPSQRD